MSDNNVPTTSAPSYFDRVIGSDFLKKGAATAIASVLVAAITEAIWPTES